jgi:competence protein ComEC
MALVAGWIVIGLLPSVGAARQDDVQLTFLSVGHGGAILIDLPDGQTWLYDAGAMAGGQKTSRAIRNHLWRSGRSHIDVLILSHADVDHFNAVPHLIQSVPIGVVLASREFLDFQQPDVSATCEALARQGIPIRLVMAGDSFLTGPSLPARFVHPPAGFSDSLDNANSLVLDLTCHGRRILLTGDIERRGLQSLLASPSMRCDLLLAPHHGGKSANTRDLARWVAPRNVIASCRRNTALPHLQEVYPDAERILTTGDDGCVCVTIRPDGEMTFTPCLQRRRSPAGTLDPEAAITQRSR